MAVLERGAVSAEDGRDYAGQWVAIKDNRILFASTDAEAVLNWVKRNRRDDIDLVTKMPKVDAPRRRAL